MGVPGVGRTPLSLFEGHVSCELAKLSKKFSEESFDEENWTKKIENKNKK